MKRKIRTLLLKRKLRNEYLLYSRIADNYSCGATLAEYISPDLQRSKERMNKTIKRLKELDSSCKFKPF